VAENTAEAFGQFVDVAKISDLRDLAKFTKVTPSTVLVWVDKEALPKGEAFFRLQHYLEGRGYENSELQTLPRPAYKLGQLIAFDVLSMEDAREVLKYATLKDLYRLLQGVGVSASRGATLQRLIAEHGDTLSLRMAEFRRLHIAPAESLPGMSISSHTLADGISGSIDILDTMLDLVDLQPNGTDEVSRLVDRAKVIRVVDRLTPFV
jgi:hypothetical protein